MYIFRSVSTRRRNSSALALELRLSCTKQWDKVYIASLLPEVAALTLKDGSLQKGHDLPASHHRTEVREKRGSMVIPVISIDARITEHVC